MAQEQQGERSMQARVGRDKQRYDRFYINRKDENLPIRERVLTTCSSRYGPGGERLVAGVVALSPDRTQVLLIQSSSRKGWVLPKGGWETDEGTQEEAACREAWEEAGIECEVTVDLGDIEERRSEAQIRKSDVAPRATYRFYEVRVKEEKATWPEQHKRERMWMVYKTAKELLKERPELLEALERSSIKR